MADSAYGWPDEALLPYSPPPACGPQAQEAGTEIQAEAGRGTTQHFIFVPKLHLGTKLIAKLSLVVITGVPNA